MLGSAFFPAFPDPLPALPGGCAGVPGAELVSKPPGRNVEPPAKANQLLSNSYSPRQTHCTGAALKITKKKKKKRNKPAQHPYLL